MKRSRLTILLVAVTCAVVVVWFALIRVEKKEKAEASSSASSLPASTSRLPATTSPMAGASQRPVAAISPRPKSQEQARAEGVKIVEGIYSAPISFYGKVVDQFGNPVAGAKVDYSVVDKFWEKGSSYHGQSDGNGYFSITGIHGAGMTVGVTKDGYDNIDGKSDRGYGLGEKLPTQDNPEILVLRKKAKAEPLYAIDRDIIVPKDGTPVEVDLKSGNPVASGQGDIKIECWASEESKDAKGHYEWHCRLSVPEGGLLKRTDPELNFNAPESGYEPSVDITMSQTAERWQPANDDQYWVKLHDGTYGRMRFRITTGGGHFASITSFVNQNPGSRNLESASP